MTGRRAAILVNLKAGSGRRVGDVATAARELINRGWRVDIESTDSADHARSVWERINEQDLDCIVVAGGDGTWHEAIQWTQDRPDTHSWEDEIRDRPARQPGNRRRGSQRGDAIPLALLPIGTGDDNARSLGFPIADPMATASLIDTGNTRSIDLGVVHCGSGSRWFSGILSVGFDSQVNERANGYRHLPGTFRYLAAAAIELKHFQPGEYRVITADGEMEVTAMLIAIGNGGFYGGGMAICPEFSVDDGVLEATIIGQLPKSRFVATLPSVYFGRHVRRPEVLTMRGREFTIEGEHQRVFADGEPIGSVPIRVECVRDALTVICA